MTVLNSRQRQWLLSDLAAGRVNQRSGGGGRSFSYLESWDIRRHLIRCFGPLGFETVVEEARLISEREGKNDEGQPNDRWTVTYLVRLRLTVFGKHAEIGQSLPAVVTPDVNYTAVATGTSANQPGLGDAHDHALKTAESDALKRAAINLGTQFGLSLYNNGSPVDVVKWTLDQERGAVAPEDAQPPADEPVVPEVSHGGTEVQATAEAAVEPAEPTEGIAYDLDPVLEAIRGTYDKELTAAVRMQKLAEIKLSIPETAMKQMVPTRRGDMTLERVFDAAASDAINAMPAATEQPAEQGAEA